METSSVNLIVDFNPRSREGSDKRHKNLVFTGGYFNPRSREGSDKGYGRITCIYMISIHAPAKGATKRHKNLVFTGGYFNPRSREGSDRIA